MIALVGWVVFVYWWWLVFKRVSEAEVVYTIVFVAVTTVLAVLLTTIWSIHNKRLHRRKGPRTGIRRVSEDYSHDRLGRTIRFQGGAEPFKRHSVVRVSVGEDRKVYAGAAAPKATVLPFTLGTAGDDRA